MQTINTYNEDCEAGEDSQQHKGAQWLEKLELPLVALDVTPGRGATYAYFTLGGLDTLPDGEVVNTPSGVSFPDCTPRVEPPVALCGGRRVMEAVCLSVTRLSQADWQARRLRLPSAVNSVKYLHILIRASNLAGQPDLKGGRANPQPH